MKKRLLQIMGIFLCLQSFYMTAGAEEIPIDEPEIEIIDTIPIEPNVVTLLENEVRYTRDWETECSDNTVKIDYMDAQLLMMVAQAEAGNQGRNGMKHIMECILNRVSDNAFPDSVHDVVFQSGQFDTAISGAIYTVEISAECHHALAELEMNKNNDKDIIAFETSVNGRSLLRYFDYLYTEKDHDFYKQKD